MGYDFCTLEDEPIFASFVGAGVQKVGIGDYHFQTERFCQGMAELVTGTNPLILPQINGENVLIKWDRTQEIVSVGKYELESGAFGGLVLHIYRGGLYGWDMRKPKGWVPDFVIECMQEITAHYQKAGIVLPESQQQIHSGLESRF
jgi:hypothetical protein